MAVKQIKLKGAPVLHKPAEDVDLEYIGTEEFRGLICDMIETMEHEKGVGLAAPQIGVGKRISIAESSDGPVALINPRITKYSKKQVADEEGCLSIPGEFDIVLRSKSVRVEALTSEGKKIDFTANGFFARIMQHEIDHLNGILYIDRVKEQKENK